MKKEDLGVAEKRTVGLQQKIDEMKRVRNEVHKALKDVHVKEEKGYETKALSTLKDTVRGIMKTGAQTFSLKLKKTHSLGDFYGRFHPSKSNKGIKRSA